MAPSMISVHDPAFLILQSCQKMTFTSLCEDSLMSPTQYVLTGVYAGCCHKNSPCTEQTAIPVVSAGQSGGATAARKKKATSSKLIDISFAQNVQKATENVHKTFGDMEGPKL